MSVRLKAAISAGVMQTMPQAMDMNITMVPMITGGCMTKPCHVPADMHIVVHGVSFVRLPKSHPTTWRIMGGRHTRVRNKWHVLDILDRLRSARNDALGKQMYPHEGCDEESPTKHDVIVNEYEGRLLRRKKLNLRELVSEVLTIIAPSIDGGDGFNMRVACPDRTTSPVAVELTTDNIRYLRMAARKWTEPPQIAHERRARMLAPKGVVRHKGVVRDTYNKRILCRVHVDTGRTRTKVFKINKFPTEIDAAARAAEFMIACAAESMSAVPPMIIELDSQPQPTESSEPLVES